MIPVCEPVLGGNEKKYVLECLETNWISSAGKYIVQFEKAFSAFCNASYGVACSSGTTAIHLALHAQGIGYGDEVIVPDFNLIVGCNMVILSGAKPVLVDVGPETMCIDPKLIEEKITKKTRAILAVHMYGHPCDMDALMKIEEKYNVAIIEDCAEAHGAEVRGRRVGGIGHMAAFSFYGNKILTTGEGGMVLTNDAALAEKLRLFRDQGFEEPRFEHKVMGFNYRMTNIQAAIGLAQTERADEKIEKKRAIANRYNSLLSGVDGLVLPSEKPWAKNVYWMYGVIVTPAFGLSKNEVVQRLESCGIETRPFFCPMHRQPCYSKKDPRFPDQGGTYPVSGYLYDNGFYLPSGEGLTTEQIEFVADKLLACRRA